MADMDMGLLGDCGASAFAQDGPVDASVSMAKPFSYCGECGSWGAHGSRCVACGYDFYADPIDSSASD